MTGLPIVWIPGHLCGRWLYAPQIEALADHPAIVADVDRDDDLAAMAGRILADAPDRFVVAGLSMGGMVAMEAMAAAPDRIAGAVLMDTDPTPARERELAFRADQRQAVERYGLEPAIRAFAQRFFGHDPEAAQRHLDAVIAKMGAKPAEVYRAQADALDGRREMAPLIASFPSPVTVIVGAEDVICPPKLHTRLAEALPDARLVEIPATGHLATIETPDLVTAAIRDLLSRVNVG